MKIEKLNDNQIKCTLSEADLAKRHLKINELTYGSKKAKDLFRDMMQRARQEVGFESEDIPLMIEAIPVEGDSIELLITKVEDPDELDARFSKFAPEYDYDDVVTYEKNDSDELGTLFSQYRELSNKSSEDIVVSENETDDEPAVPSDRKNDRYNVKAVVYSFDSLKDIIRVAHTATKNNELRTSLYVDDNNRYYLYVGEGNVDRAVAHTFFALREYGVSENYARFTEDYLMEHCRLLMKDNALSTLSKM